MTEQDPRLEPDSIAMQAEPARTIADHFADQTMMRTLVAAVVAVCAKIFGWVADDDLIEDITTLITIVSVLYAAWSAQRDAAKRAVDQGEMTRDAVFAPATVERVRRRAYDAGKPPTEPLPPPPDPVEEAEVLTGVERMKRDSERLVEAQRREAEQHKVIIDHPE